MRCLGPLLFVSLQEAQILAFFLSDLGCGDSSQHDCSWPYNHPRGQWGERGNLSLLSGNGVWDFHYKGVLGRAQSTRSLFPNNQAPFLQPPLPGSLPDWLHISLPTGHEAGLKGFTLKSRGQPSLFQLFPISTALKLDASPENPLLAGTEELFPQVPVHLSLTHTLTPKGSAGGEFCGSRVGRHTS